ncbi:uncharacterized protein LDX57_009737 [Aspergillus melleus]|uniref:uncharacterized protein n=1 Tax=Aspergillus melleus TaxID=138277 RepID=UPI001E8CEDD5|nr:uncharacterized protein LDX57_009737 [Aspergillus melleus]KAH8432091.1 hypothetical protein LDX57_009737 [Aspergillus melleus]
MASSTPPTLDVVLSPLVLPFSQPTIPIQVAIHNAASTPVTIVNWNTPLDPRAGVLGVFQVRDTTTDDIVPMDELKISRQLPPSADDLVEIPAGRSVEAVVRLPSGTLVAGHEYAIRAKGIWHAVWETPREEVQGLRLEKFENAKRGDFLSNEVSVREVDR